MEGKGGRPLAFSHFPPSAFRHPPSSAQPPARGPSRHADSALAFDTMLADFHVRPSAIPFVVVKSEVAGAGTGIRIVAGGDGFPLSQIPDFFQPMGTEIRQFAKGPVQHCNTSLLSEDAC